MYSIKIWLYQNKRLLYAAGVEATTIKSLLAEFNVTITGSKFLKKLNAADDAGMSLSHNNDDNDMDKKMTARFLNNCKLLGLSLCQTDVMIQKRAGCSDKMAADNLSLSSLTINAHLKNIYCVLQVHNALEAVRKIENHGGYPLFA